MKVKDVVEIGVGIAAPAALVAVVSASAPAGGIAAITWALKKIGFGAVKRSFFTLGATSVVSSKAAGAGVDYIESCIKANGNEPATV